MLYRKTSYADGVFDRYLFERDVFGNIISVYNIDTGAKVGSYCYDAWGNCTVLTNTNGIGAMNPFRYRGYYLDTETNLYYLQTRYYDSYVGRFINADGVVNGNGDIIGFNKFAYCSDNPVMFTDYTGEGWLQDFWNKVKQAATQLGQWFSDTFGAEYTTSVTTTTEEQKTSDILPITVTAGRSTTVNVTTVGDSSKPISVYANRDLEDFSNSTAGLKINIGSFTLDFSWGLRNTGITASISDGDLTQSFGVRTDAKSLKHGVEYASTYKLPGGEDKTYVNYSVNDKLILELVLVLSGSPSPTPVPAY